MPDQSRPEPTQTDVSRLVAGYIRAANDKNPGQRVGPFTVLFDPTSANPWRNYAVPDERATPSADDVAALINVFEAHGRTPRLEYVPADAPAVEAVLARAGFVVDGRPPLMACRPDELASPPPVEGVTLTAASSAADLLDVAGIQNEAYGEPEPAGPDDVARLAATISRGGIVALARDSVTGEPAGAGLCTGPIGGVSELAAVGVGRSYRRRGIATAITVMLTASAHQRGARLVWLEPAGEREAGVYLRAGFAASGHKLWISRPIGGITARCAV